MAPSFASVYDEFILYIKKFWRWHLIPLLGIPIYIYTVQINIWGLYGELPSLELLENPKDALSSELYSSDGVLLGKYFRHNRSPVDYDDISKILVQALVATEDARFESHSGLDIKAIMRAVILSIALRQGRGGGSTLTQQLAKNLFKLRHKEFSGVLSRVPIVNMIITKTKECIVAVRLERAYSKKEIISMYLNTASFGSNAYGIKVASKAFFNADQKKLSVLQAATLVGLLKAPSYYSPIRHPERAMVRRNVVLGQMLKENFLSRKEYDRYRAEPLVLEVTQEDHNSGYATYFRSAIRNFLLKWGRKNGYDIFQDGLRIYTTLDSRMQRYAEEALCAHMKSLQREFDEHWRGTTPWRDESGEEIENFVERATKTSDIYAALRAEYGDDAKAIAEIMNTPVPAKLFSWNGEMEAMMSPVDQIKYNKRFLHAGFIAVEPTTGEIRAWVGGIDHRYFQFDHVMYGTRQCGSAFKPIVYAAALDNGFMPWSMVVDVPVTFKLETEPFSWTPQNWNKIYSGKQMTLRQALAKSINSITAYLTKQLGPQTIVDYAKRLGITTKMDPSPAICLGSSDVSLYELVGAYSTFMNRGVWVRPHFITRIEDKHGKVLEEFHPEKREAVSESTAYLMLYMLKGTVADGGTSAGISASLKVDNEIAGKTGTTQNQSDGWFIGMSSNLCVGVWVGGDDRCIHFRNIALGSGAHMARPIWEKFMSAMYGDSQLGYKKGALTNQKAPKNLEQYRSVLCTNDECHESSLLN